MSGVTFSYEKWLVLMYWYCISISPVSYAMLYPPVLSEGYVLWTVNVCNYSACVGNTVCWNDWLPWPLPFRGQWPYTYEISINLLYDTVHRRVTAGGRYVNTVPLNQDQPSLIWDVTPDIKAVSIMSPRFRGCQLSCKYYWLHRFPPPHPLSIVAPLECVRIIGGPVTTNTGISWAPPWVLSHLNNHIRDFLELQC